MRKQKLALSFVRHGGAQSHPHDCAPLTGPGTAFAPLANKSPLQRAYVDGDGAVRWDIDPAADSTAA